MKDKIQEAAEKRLKSMGYDLRFFSTEQAEIYIGEFKAGATYMQEQNKESIQELVGALEVAKESIIVMNDDSEDHPTIRFIDSLIQKHKQ